MSDSFRSATGRKVVSRASASDLGFVSHFLVDVGQRRIAAIVVGRGRKARLIDWTHVSGFGPDAVMVSDEGSLRTAVGDREQAAADGKLDMVGTRSLTESGNEVGTISDVTFDPATGAVEMLHIGDRMIPAGSVLGSGAYAVVVDARQDSAP